MNRSELAVVVIPKKKLQNAEIVNIRDLEAQAAAQAGPLAQMSLNLPEISQVQRMPTPKPGAYTASPSFQTKLPQLVAQTWLKIHSFACIYTDSHTVSDFSFGVTKGVGPNIKAMVPNI